MCLIALILVFLAFSLFFISGFEEVGCVSSERYQEALRVKNSLGEALAALQDLTMSTHKWRKTLPEVHISDAKAAVLR